MSWKAGLLLLSLATSCLMLPLPARSAAETRFTGKCIAVADGDTITVLRSGNEQVRIRLDGIDAPEKGDSYSNKAKKFTSSLVFDRQVEIRGRDRDRYGRTVARVIVDGTDVSVALVQAGLAWHYTKYSDDPELARAEHAARAAEINIWSLPNPLPPWEVRAGTREATAPEQAQDILYHGNRRSRVFHGPSCRYYNCNNCTVQFTSREAAIAAGYRPGGHCRP